LREGGGAEGREGSRRESDSHRARDAACDERDGDDERPGDRGQRPELSLITPDRMRPDPGEQVVERRSRLRIDDATEDIRERAVGHRGRDGFVIEVALLPERRQAERRPDGHEQEQRHSGPRPEETEDHVGPASAGRDARTTSHAVTPTARTNITRDASCQANGSSYGWSKAFATVPPAIPSPTASCSRSEPTTSAAANAQTATRRTRN